MTIRDSRQQELVLADRSAPAAPDAASSPHQPDEHDRSAIGSKFRRSGHRPARSGHHHRRHFRSNAASPILLGRSALACAATIAMSIGLPLVVTGTGRTPHHHDPPK